MGGASCRSSWATLAQLVERLIRNQQVAGSIPAGGSSDKSEAFFNDHPNFWGAFEKLMSVSNECFGRTCHYENQAESLMFSLGQACREDYLEIAFMGVHGFDTATTKLLRGLYERAVTHAYIIKNPEKVMRFIRFGRIQQYRVMRGALEAGISKEELNNSVPPDYSFAKVTERRNEVKDEFKVQECEICGMKAPVSWEKASMPEMAKKAGDFYRALYLGGYAMTNLYVYATFASAVGLEGLDEKTAAIFRKDTAYSNMGQASAVMLLVLKEQNELFKLGLEQEIEAAENAIVEEWFSKHATANS